MDEAKMVAQLISVRPTNGWSLGDEVTRRDIEILRHCEEVVRTSKWWPRRRWKAIATKLESYRRLLTHGLLCLFHLLEGTNMTPSNLL
jgi:hypothetical protein